MTQRRDSVMARKTLIAALLGTLTEWYDFAVYGYMATVLSKVFFPVDTDPALAILATLAVYGVAFLARPLGAIYFGSLGDRIGRRTTLAIIVVGMGVATLFTGLLPSYAAIGVTAPILLVVLRLVQGIFAGGEQTGASALISEWAPRERRALWTCLSPTASALSFLLAVGVVLATQTLVPAGAWESWGWRIPFIFGGIISMVGLYLRIKLDDSPVFEQLEEERTVADSPFRFVVRNYWRQILAVAAGASIYGVSYYSLAGLMPTYLKQTVAAQGNIPLLSNLFAFILLACLIPVFGYLSDRFGRRPVLAVGVAGVILVIPGFMIAGIGTLAAATVGQFLIVLPIAAMNASMIAIVVEIFPPSVRLSGSAAAWNLAQMVFGGTAPLVGTFLVTITGNPFTPAFYILGVGVFASVVMVALKLPETKDLDLVRQSPSALSQDHAERV